MFFLMSSCCEWKYPKEDFEFTENELKLLGPYKVNDTIYFESNLGDIDTITILHFEEVRHEKGGSCIFPTAGPYHYIQIFVKHLPIDNYTGTTQNEGEEMKVTYQMFVSIGKAPFDSINKNAGYHISFKNFISDENVFKSHPQNFTLNKKSILDCYNVFHGYPERVINPNDIEIVYWTAKYGLTAYSSKSGETWLIKDFK